MNELGQLSLWFTFAVAVVVILLVLHCRRPSRLDPP